VDETRQLKVLKPVYYLFVPKGWVPKDTKLVSYERG